MDTGESALRQHIPALVSQVLVLDERLAAIVPHREEKKDGTGGGGGKKPHSPAPWNAAAAHARLDLHALVREIELKWRSAAGFPARPRGGSDANTRKALEVLAQLAFASGVEGELRAGVKELERWRRGAAVVLGDAERPRRVPGTGTGDGEPRCPGCCMRTLRMWTLQGIIRCVNPACVSKPVALVEYTDSEGIVLTWQEGEGGSDAAAPR